MPAWVLAVVGAFTFGVGYLRSFLFPATPLLLWGDSLGYATKGVRMLEGELPYRDFFDFVTPGTQLIYALVFRCVGVAMWAPNLLMCIMAAATAVWVTWCARSLVTGKLVYLPAVLVTGIVMAGSFDATHHWFSTLLTMGAAAVLFNGFSSRRIVLAGILCGLAASFTQTKGAALTVALLAYLCWKSRAERADRRQLLRRGIQLCVPAMAVFLAINLPFVLAAGLQRWYSDLIVFPLLYFGSVSANNWHVIADEFAGKRGLLKCVCLPFLYLAVPLSYVWVFVELWRRGKRDYEKQYDQLLLLALVGVAMLMMVAPSPSLRRISCVSPPAMILLASAISRGRTLSKMAAGGLAAISVIVAFTQVAPIQLRHHERLNLPVGQVAIPGDDDAEVYKWMASRTHPGQWYFGMPPYTLPLRLKNPTPIESPAPGDYMRPEQIAAAIAGLERTRPELLLLRPVLYIPHFLGLPADHLQPFHDYLVAHYRRTKTFATGDEAWERSP